MMMMIVYNFLFKKIYDRNQSLKHKLNSIKKILYVTF